MNKHIEALKHYAALAALSVTLHNQHWVIMGGVLLLMFVDAFAKKGD